MDMEIGMAIASSIGFLIASAFCVILAFKVNTERQKSHRLCQEFEDVRKEEKGRTISMSSLFDGKFMVVGIIEHQGVYFLEIQDRRSVFRSVYTSRSDAQKGRILIKKGENIVFAQETWSTT